MLDEETRERLAAAVREIRAAGTFKEERVIGSPQGVRITRGARSRGAELLRQQLPGPGLPPRGDRGRARGPGPLGIRDGIRALHLRHPGGPPGAGDSAWRPSWERRTPSSTRPASTQTAASSSRSWTRTAPSSPTSSTTPPSSTGRACARRGGSSTPTRTWRTWSEGSPRRPPRRLRLIVTDGVFSMDGDFARLPEICAIAEKHGALVMVDDSHATGFIGRTGRGTRRALRRHGPGGRSSPRPSERRLAAPRAAASRAAGRSSSSSASEAGRTCSPTPWRPWWQPPPSLSWTS